MKTKSKLPETAVLICKSCAKAQRAHKLTPEEVAMIQPGAYTKVSCCSEGFWVKITKVKGTTVQGTVDNDLVQCTHYKFGDPVELKLSEIYQVLPKD